MEMDLESYKYFVSQGLTPREVVVAYWVSQGLTNKEISEKLFVSEGTIKYHVTNVYKKLGAANRSQFVKNYWKSMGNNNGKGQILPEEG